MVYSRYEKQRILYHSFKGVKAPTIAKILVEEERLDITRQEAHSILKRYRETRMADGQAMGDHLLSQKMSRRLWRLKYRLVLNFKHPSPSPRNLVKEYEVRIFFFLRIECAKFICAWVA